MKTTTKSMVTENDTQEYQLVLFHPESYPDPFENLEREAGRYGVTSMRVTTEFQPMMAIVDYIPVIIVGVTSGIAGGFLGEVGKDLNNALKKSLPGLWNRIYGPASEKISLFKVTTEGAERVKDAPKFAYMAKTPHGQVSLYLPEECSREDFEQACGKFLDLVFEHPDGISGSQIDINDSKNYIWGRMILTYNPEKRSLVVVPTEFDRKSQK